MQRQNRNYFKISVKANDEIIPSLGSDTRAAASYYHRVRARIGFSSSRARRRGRFWPLTAFLTSTICSQSFWSLLSACTGNFDESSPSSTTGPVFSVFFLFFYFFFFHFLRYFSARLPPELIFPLLYRADSRSNGKYFPIIRLVERDPTLKWGAYRRS